MIVSSVFIAIPRDISLVGQTWIVSRLRAYVCRGYKTHTNQGQNQQRSLRNTDSIDIRWRIPSKPPIKPGRLQNSAEDELDLLVQTLIGARTRP